MFAKVLVIAAFVACTQSVELGHATSYSSLSKQITTAQKVAVAPVAHIAHVAHVAPVAHVAHLAPVTHYAHAEPIAHYAHAAPIAHYSHAAPIAHYAHAAPIAHYAHAAPVAHVAHVSHVAPVAHVAHVSHVAPVAHVSHVAPVAHYSHVAPVAHYSHVAPVAHYSHVAPVAHVAHKEVYADSHPHYSFAYGVKDTHTGDIKNQHEERDGDVVKGEYSLVQPDGTTRTVHYSADHHNGFNAHVEYSGHAAHPEQKTVLTKTLLAAPAYPYHH